MSDLVLTERDGPVAVVTLNRPDALNALSDELMEQLVSALLANATNNEWSVSNGGSPARNCTSSRSSRRPVR